MHDDAINELGFWSSARAQFRERLRGFASIAFMLLAVGAIHFQEQMSPAFDRIGDAFATSASKTVRSANLALMSAALPFFLRA